MSHRKLWCALGVTAAVSACGGAPPKELLDARAAYEQARTAPSAAFGADDLATANKALVRAEESYKSEGDSEATRALAYVASRRSIFAAAQAGVKSDLNTIAVANTEAHRLEQRIVLDVEGKLTKTEGALAESQRQADSERQARIAAEQKTQAALDKMTGMVLKQNDKGTVITLSGSVLFATNKSELMGNARAKLGDVVAALKDDPRAIQIVGYTDSRGSDEVNDALSQKRAESVQQFLISQGIPASRVKATGMGKRDPIADNSTAEGRANNRRVEIILLKGDAPSTKTDSGNARP